MNPITDSNGNITGYWDNQMQYYDAYGNPMTNDSGQPMLYDPTTNSLIDPATAYGASASASPSIVSYQGSTPPISSAANAILKTLTGQYYKYDATGSNPVPYTPPASNMAKIALYGGLAAIAYVMLKGK